MSDPGDATSGSGPSAPSSTGPTSSALGASVVSASVVSVEAGSAYDVLAAEYARLLPDLSAEAPGERAMLERFAREAADLGGRVLDAGCGTGRVARWLAARGLHVTGVDVSVEMIAQAQAAGAAPPGPAATDPSPADSDGVPVDGFVPSGEDVELSASGAIDYVVGELATLPVADASQDAVLLWYSLIHLPRSEHDAVWAEVARVLGMKGVVLVAVQGGHGEVDLSEFYAALGHEVTLRRWRHTPAALICGAAAHGLRSRQCRVRGPRGQERDEQAVVLFGR